MPPTVAELLDRATSPLLSFEFFPPLVDTEPEEKPLSIALREVAADKLQVISGEDARARRAAAEEARRAAETDVFSDIPLDAAPLPGGEDAQAPGDLDSIEF